MKDRGLIPLIVTLLLINFSVARKRESIKSQELLKKEREKLLKTGVTCPNSIAALSTLDRLRLTNQFDIAIACHISYLEKFPEDSWAWSSLGSTYLLQATSKSSSRATTCFKAASKYGGKVTEFIRQWHYLGPFVIGKMELDGDPVETYGGIEEAAKKRYNKKERYISELAPEGEIGWMVYKQTHKGETIKIMPQLDWNDLVNSLGSTAILEWQGWIVGEFAVNEEGVTVIIQCLGVHTIYVDDTPITGDVYHRNTFWFSVNLDRGTHILYIRLRAKARGMFSCTIQNPTSTFEVLKPHYLPDLYNGHLFGTHIAIPVSNYNSKKWLKDIRITIESQSHGQPLTVTQKDKLGIAPGQTRPINIQLSSESDDPISENCADLEIVLNIRTPERQTSLPLTLRCRKLRESFLYTFLDHDGSVQHAAAIEPLESCSDGLCPVLLTLHGTTVPPQNQADSYKYMEDEQFVFGLQKAWVLAPTRHGAHNWEGPGALTAISALDHLATISGSKEWISNKASSQHVIFAGHSMGGHGAWNLATHFPDRALAVISLAGWIKKEEYGDSNFFFRHDIATTNVDPAVKAVMEACIAENEADRLAPNLMGLSVLMRIGAADRTIHPYFTRRMFRVLKALGVDVSYSELPKKEHWWWDTWETNDGGAVHDPQLRNFSNLHSTIPRDVTGQACADDTEKCTGGEGDADKYKKESQGLDSFSYVTINPAFGETMRGLRILRQITPFRTSEIKVKITGDTVELTSSNVAKFSISEPPNRRVGWFQKIIKIDDQTLLTQNVWSDESLCACKDNGGWKVCSDCQDLESITSRGPRNLGPARRVAERPFLIVLGTQNAMLVNRLREMTVYIANLFYLTSDTNAPIITDTQLTQEMADNHNLIIMGSPMENSWTASYMENVPINLNSDGLGLGTCLFSAKPTGTLFLAPNGRHLAMVVMATSVSGLQDVISLATPTIPPMTRSPFSNLLPDFVITGPSFRAHGPGGYSCVGFWGNNWDLRSDLISCSHCA